MKLNIHSEEIIDALYYMKMYSFRLLKYNHFVSDVKITNFGVIVNYRSDDGSECLGVYILKRYRGKKLLKKIVRSSEKSLLLFSEADISLTSYCTRNKINCKYVGAMEKERAYISMREYLGDRATDTGIKDVDKIEQTLAILEWMKSSNICKIAACYIAKMSSEVELEKNWGSFSSKDDPKAILLAMEYRRIILQYSIDSISSIHPSKVFTEIKLPNIKDVSDSILAHIMVNYYSFEKNYKDKHPRASRVQPYFINWLSKLESSHVYTIFKNRLSTIEIFDHLISENKPLVLKLLSH